MTGLTASSFASTFRSSAGSSSIRAALPRSWMADPQDPFALPPGPLMLFDGMCNFCSGSAGFVLARSRGRRLKFCAMQTPRGEAVLRRLGLPLTDYATVVLVEEGAVRVKSEAVLGLAAHM